MIIKGIRLNLLNQLKCNNIFFLNNNIILILIFDLYRRLLNRYFYLLVVKFDSLIFYQIYNYM